MKYLLFSFAILFCVSCGPVLPVHYVSPAQAPVETGEEYDQIVENTFLAVADAPLSTFSIDVDGASYSNVRRFINDGYLPPPNAVRIEEMINYFDYEYPEPAANEIFSVHTELTSAPWNQDHQLLQIGIKAREIHANPLPPSNLVFLLDVSGSMRSPDKLPLLKQGFRLLVDQLRQEDYISIVVYAGSSEVVLPPTSGKNKEKILKTVDRLRAGGSTAGGQGIRLAYDAARESFIEGANNRVILATDGDFNVGVRSDDQLITLIEKERDDGIFLSILGFGTGNLKDSKMEKIANHGNGNYYYIDNLLEAEKVLVTDIRRTLYTVAMDVKIQVEFNPVTVHAYRLIGYENRLLSDRDFNDDKKDAGELGAGHTVTALYEIIPASISMKPGIMAVDPLKYGDNVPVQTSYSDEILTWKLRYKSPEAASSTLINAAVKVDDFHSEMSPELSFASSVAGFGMILRDSQFKGTSSFDMILELATDGLSNDSHGYRSEFIRLVKHAQLLSQTIAP